MSSPSTPAAPSSRAFPVALVLAAGCGIAMLSLGERSAFGLFQNDMVNAHPWGRETFALAFALQNLVWGMAQPVTGGLADRYGTMKVLMVGGVLYALGTAGAVYASSSLLMHLMFGVLVGVGLAASSFTIVISAFSRAVGPEQRTLAFGLGTAAGSLGMFLFGPVGAILIATQGWENALLAFAGFALLIIPFAVPLQGRSKPDPATASQSALAALKEALGYRSYVLLVFGFFVCGFHVAFIIAHMPAYIEDLGLSTSVGGTAIALIGLFNVIGCLAAGVIGQRMSKSYSLSVLYLLRSVLITAFVLTPISAASVITFSALMGLLWLSTVPFTSGLVATMFGPRYMGMLFGVVFFSHQVGSFLGVWLGGVIYAKTGSYDMLWWIGVALGLFAAVVHMPIRDAPAPRPLAAAA
ncbi:MFS transporter [Acuticoccus mangrovi]|uniref:MFS transporter n=1 Tax=Acuticoccus mangrovi TaxID=2796142 RepID=A0A934MIV3_9HYPH|nr:MFS transporter [Acuticoccus mangrovi]MBJ3778285.1 MFS transporter [Acuticoccus mangrovi]